MYSLNNAIINRWNKYIEYEMLAKYLPIKVDILLVSNLLRQTKMSENEIEQEGKNKN